MVDRIVDILDDDGTLDLEQRKDSWSSTGPSAGTAGTGKAGTGASDLRASRTSGSDFGAAGLGAADSLTTGGPNTGIGAAASTTTGLTTGLMGAESLASERAGRRQSATDFDSAVDSDLDSSGTPGAPSTASSEAMRTDTRRSAAAMR